MAIKPNSITLELWEKISIVEFMIIDILNKESY